MRGTWREGGLGAIEDLAPHLIDLVGHVVGEPGVPFSPWSIQRHETVGVDQAVLGSADGRLVLEVSYVCWKNSFAVELFGERGSLHLTGLRKWGGSELVWRRRVLPSGVPIEQRERSEGSDVTWERDLAHFEAHATHGATSLENDWWISRELRRAAASHSVAAQC